MTIPEDEIARLIKTAPVPFRERDRVAVHFATGLKARFGADFDSGTFLKLCGIEPLQEGGSGPGIAEMTRRMRAEEARAAYEEHTANHPTIHTNRFPTWEELTPTERKRWEKERPDHHD